MLYFFGKHARLYGKTCRAIRSNGPDFSQRQSGNICKTVCNDRNSGTYVPPRARYLCNKKQDVWPDSHLYPLINRQYFFINRKALSYGNPYDIFIPTHVLFGAGILEKLSEQTLPNKKALTVIYTRQKPAAKRQADDHRGRRPHPLPGQSICHLLQPQQLVLYPIRKD